MAGSWYTAGGVIPASGGNYTAAYAPGGLVSAPASRSSPAVPQPGMPGFAGRGAQDFEPAAGVVTGVRWWGLPAPDLTRDPLAADAHWPRRWLHGARAGWQPGLNEAACLQGCGHPVPEESCGDGHWAFWKVTPYPLGYDLPVLGVIEGSGRVLSGEKGFRCQRARIVALHLDSLAPAGPPASWQWTALGTGLYAEEVTPSYPLLSPDWLDAWRAVISDRLEQLYPDARVYENRDTMLTVHPPDPPPAPPEPARAQCPFCTARMTAPELADHQHRCPLRLP
jgi:hypothetical protein